MVIDTSWFAIISIFTAITLTILQGASVIDIGWFWATFAFWAWVPINIIVVFILIVVGVIAANRSGD